MLVLQVNDVASLRDENKRLMIIAQQLEPYIRSITALMERISPKLQVSPRPLDTPVSAAAGAGVVWAAAAGWVSPWVSVGWMDECV